MNGQSVRTPHCVSSSRAFKVELEPYFFHAVFAQHMSQLGLLFRIEHQKTAPARTDQFPTQCAVGHGQVIQVIDVRVRHALEIASSYSANERS